MDARAGSLWHKIAVKATPRNSPRHRGGPVCLSVRGSGGDDELRASSALTSPLNFSHVDHHSEVFLSHHQTDLDLCPVIINVDSLVAFISNQRLPAFLTYGQLVVSQSHFDIPTLHTAPCCHDLQTCHQAAWSVEEIFENIANSASVFKMKIKTSLSPLSDNLSTIQDDVPETAPSFL